MSEGNSANVVVFINTRSGGQMGAKILPNFEKAGIVVCDIFKKSPQIWIEELLSSKKIIAETRILIAGGDGTVKWIFESLKHVWEKPETSSTGIQMPYIAVLPLGTGNDFSRITKWGAKYSGQASSDKKIKKLIENVSNAESQKFDRWNALLENTKTKEIKNEAVVNYFSFGVDAQVAAEFDSLRSRKPHVFKSPIVNKAIYGFYGVIEVFKRHPKIHNNFQIKVNGQELTIPKNSKAIIIVNINSYSAGIKVWSPNTKKGFAESSFNDGRLEILSMSSAFQAGLIRTRIFRLAQLAQTEKIEIIPKENCVAPMFYQIDGEPKKSDPLHVTIQFSDQVGVLIKKKK